MADFLPAFRKSAGKEGVYDNDPADSGAETYRGVARAKFPSWNGWLIVDNMRPLPDFPKCLDVNADLQFCLRTFYKTQFWDRLGGDLNPSQAVAEELLDTAINCGIGYAIPMAQGVLNVGNRDQLDYQDVEADGILRLEDLTALKALLAKRGDAAVVKVMNQRQGARYFELSQKNPRLERFFWGWILNRT